MTMSAKFEIDICPACGSKEIKRVVHDVTRNYAGQTYTVTNLSFYECPDCGEKVYDRDAMRKIEVHSPAYRNSGSLVDV